jgi:flagellar motor switch protein FliN/FliY
MADDKDNLAALEAEMTATVAPAPALSSKPDKMSGIPDTSHRNLSLIMDIPLRVAVELGRTKMVVNDLLNLGQGSVIELNKLAGEPMEVLVNDKLVARGEAVVVNEKFGVRLTDIISPSERVEQLK